MEEGFLLSPTHGATNRASWKAGTQRAARAFLALPVRNGIDKKCRNDCGIATGHRKNGGITIS
jgi:hypothetical protein